MARLLVGLVGLVSLALAPSAAAATFAVNSTGDGAGSCTAGGTCTLRAAIQSANASPGADQIVLPAGHYTLTIPGAGEDASATGDLDVTDDLTITGADARSTVIDGGGLDRVIDVPDAATHLSVSGVTITGGSAGGIRSLGTLGLVDSAVTGNVGGSGIASFGPLTVARVTLAGNSVDGDGGGIFADPGPSGTTTIVNSTIAGNVSSAAAGKGGGIAIESGSFTLQNDTIAKNQTTGSAGEGGGLDFGGAAVGRLSNTIIAENSAANGADCGPGGAALDSTHDATGSASCALHGPGDTLIAAGELGPLQDNGGPAATMSVSFMPLLDGGDAGSCPATDERGGRRPQGKGCDIGAYESGALADLAVGAASTSSTVPVLSPVTIRVGTVLNGPDRFLPLIDVSVTLPKGLRPSTHLVNTCFIRTQVTCAFRGPGNGEFQLKPTRTGTFSLTASVSSPATDPDPSNDSRTVTFDVDDPACHIVKRGNRHRNRLRGTRYGDRLIGGAGNDRLFGYAGADCLSGGRGNDVLDPGPGRDHVSGGPGNDRLLLRDGSRDVADCGRGDDTAVVDRHDRVRHCEHVVRRTR